jgi:dnd system-associated protein 4
MRRFNRSKNKQSVIDSLLAGESGPFSQIWQIMIFSACLGYKIGKREPLNEVDSSVAIPASVFSNNCQSWPGLVYLINLVSSSDPASLNSDDASDDLRMKVLEEYANAGLSYIREKLESRSYSIDSVLQLLQENSREASVSSSGNIETI